MTFQNCEGGDGRCTAYGRTIRRGGTADGGPTARPRADAVITPATTSTTRAGRPGGASTPTRRTGTGATPARPPGGPGERAHHGDHHHRRRGARTAPAAGPGAARTGPLGTRPRHRTARPRPGLRGVRRRRRVRLGHGRDRPGHGRLRAQRRGRHRGRLLLPVRPRPAGALPLGLAAVRPVLDHGLPRQRGLGVVRGRARPARAQPVVRRSVLPVLRAARHRGSAGARQTPGEQGRLDLPRAGRLADRRLAAHPLVEPGARPGGPVRRAERGPHRAVAGVPAAGHRARQHGARAALPPGPGQPHGGQHRDRRARPDRDVRRAVHLAAAAQQLPLRATAGRGLVRRLAAARLRPLGRAPARERAARRSGGGARPRDPRAAVRRARDRPPPRPRAGAGRRTRPLPGGPAAHRLARRAHPVPRRGGVHAGHPVQRPQRPQARPRGADHGGLRRARTGDPPGHHAAGQHHPHPGTGAEGEPLPLPGAGVERRHHDRRAQRHTALRLPGRRRGLRPPRRGPGGQRAGRPDPPRGPGLRGARGAPLPRRQPGGGAHHPHRVPLPLRRWGHRPLGRHRERGRLAERRVHRQPAPRRADLQQPGRHRTGAPPGPVAAQRGARPAHRPAQPRPVHPTRPAGPVRAPGHRPGRRPAGYGGALHRPRRLQGRQRHHRAPGRRRTPDPGRPQTPGRGPPGRHRLPAGRRRVRGPDRRGRHARPGGPGAQHPGAGRPAQDDPVPAVRDRRQGRPGQRLHRGRLRRARPRRGRAAAQRRPRDVPREVGRKGPGRAVPAADAAGRRTQGGAGQPAARRVARRRVHPAAPAGGAPGGRPDHGGRRAGPLAFRAGGAVHPGGVPAGGGGRRQDRRAGPLDPSGGRRTGRRTGVERVRRTGGGADERPAAAGPLAAAGLGGDAADPARAAARGAGRRAVRHRPRARSGRTGAAADRAEPARGADRAGRLRQRPGGHHRPAATARGHPQARPEPGRGRGGVRPAAQDHQWAAADRLRPRAPVGRRGRGPARAGGGAARDGLHARHRHGLLRAAGRVPAAPGARRRALRGAARVGRTGVRGPGERRAGASRREGRRGGVHRRSTRCFRRRQCPSLTF
ncbi:conserved hypothetical protein [Streptomyces misionensis JCM 4497]